MKIRKLKIENFLQQQRGFTLIELLVVIFIIGTLTGIIMPNFIGSRQRARDSRRKHDLIEIKSALRLYYNDNQTYPSNVFFGNQFGADGEYMNQVPQDPLSGSRSYDYCVADSGDGFVLCADLENDGDGDNLTLAESSCNGICPADDLCDCGDADDQCYFVCAN
jgi:prepilin-type N-terminal cleavage/methylation domain-containing protein